MLMMNAPGKTPYQIFSWAKSDIEAHIAFMRNFAQKLSSNGELVSAEGLAGPDQAKLVRGGTNGEAVTDGVFPRRRSSSWVTGSSMWTRRTCLRRGSGSVDGARSERHSAAHAHRGAAGDERPADRLSTGLRIRARLAKPNISCARSRRRCWAS